MRRAALIAGSVACLALAALFGLLAADVERWHDTVRTDDARFPAEPSRSTWRAGALVPLEAAETLLGTGDDVDFRLALRSVRLGRPDQPAGFDPAYVVMRNDATTRLNAIVRANGSGERRSAAANLLGVLAFAEASFAFEGKAGLFAAAANRFRQAVQLDPANDDAKYNLEITLSRQSQLELSEASGGNNPSPGGRGARGAGAADAGSGY